MNLFRAITQFFRPAVTKFRQYEAALTNRLTGAWNAWLTNANNELRLSQRILRNRVRDRERNDAWTARLFDILEQEVVGAEGVTFQSKAVTPRGRDDVKKRTIIETAWNKWCESVTPDGMSMTASLWLILRSIMRDGECFIVLRTIDEQLQLQLLESDYCDELQGGDFPMGIKVNQYGKPEAYSFYERHPGSLEGGGAKYQISANDVLHPAYKTRIGQLRGVPKIAPALMRTWQLGKYEEAELISARQQACAGVFFKKTLPEGWTGDPVDGDVGQIGVVTEPGQGIELPYGVEAQVYNPTHPHSNYTAFTQAQLRALAVCGGVSFHVLSGDLTSVNYSSARIGYLSDQSGWKMLQELLISRVLEPVFNRWLETEIAFGRLPVAFSLPNARAHTWHPKRWVWVDPQAEAAGLSAMLENRLMSPQQAIASGGRDPDEVLRECAAWSAKLDALGVTGGPATTFGPAKPDLAPLPDTQGDGDDEDGEPDLYAPEEIETETEDAA